ncbi:MAG: hypothetical protein ACE5OR_13270, partial [bacterium]
PESLRGPEDHEAEDSGYHARGKSVNVIHISTSIHKKKKEKGSEKERRKTTTTTTTFGYILF